MPETPAQTAAAAAIALESKLSSPERAKLQESAISAARSCSWLDGRRHSSGARRIYKKLRGRLSTLESELYRLRSDEPSEDLRWLYDNFRLIRTDLESIRDALRPLSRLPGVRTRNEERIPRVIVLSRSLIAAANDRLNEAVFSQFVLALEEIEPLRLNELGGMLDGLKVALLEELSELGPKALDAFRKHGRNAQSFGIGDIITSLRFIGERDWRSILEPLSVVHRTLLEDPAGVYPQMDYESRELYRLRIAKVAASSDVEELELARRSVNMAREAVIQPDTPEAVSQRLRHLGYYLVDLAGSQDLLRQVGYRPSFGSSLQRLFRRFPDEVYILGVEAVALITVVALIMSIVRSQGGLGLIFGALLLLIPATQAAVEVVNYLVTAVLTPHPLPKLDFSRAVDRNSATMVAIPTLLINDKQIRQLVEDLEVRYLVNRDPNIFYALLTDLPDSAEPPGEQDRRVDLAIDLINELNVRYASEPFGGFYLFHRHRVYNPREGAWMGWERKRGKLLDLNQLLRNVYDPFPVKTGDLKKLPLIRYVLTLDSDTQLPRGSAQRMIGAMAHPLNRPVIDPDLNVVTSGYGILQPRVGISVHSASRSRLASIYSGQTGFDIYSRAISDVYQDLYGEAIFTGKGIYDVDALRRVLEHRFPRNALLSHDLIEGAYARAGLASDIEVIDDYPSHYSAYNRRKHRWLRGDWQIVRWIFNTVPDESGRLVENPISLVSRWKILDNLRRSLVEPATFLLLIAGWFWLPGGSRFWTLVTLALLFLPIYFRLIFAIARTTAAKNWISLRDSISDFFTSHISIAFNIVFLAHQGLVAIDAIVRTVIRSSITHTRLLEWETATEAELGIRKRTPVDMYLDWVPLVSILVGLGLLLRPAAAPYALPFLTLWACAKLISNWLNRSPHEILDLAETDRLFLRGLALRTWRYFAEFSNEKNHWLIPDNVQEQPYRIAERLSPTNLGLLFNARQAALEFGYLTLPEFIEQNERTLETLLKLQRCLGHLLNWYDNISLKPLGAEFISSVDSGNLIASLWSFAQGCRELLRKPLISDNALAGIADHYRMLEKSAAQPALAGILKLHGSPMWLPELLKFNSEDLPISLKPADPKQHVSWPLELRARMKSLREAVRQFMPWFLPEYEALRDPASGLEISEKALSPQSSQEFVADFDERLRTLSTHPSASKEMLELAGRLRAELPSCLERIQAYGDRLQNMASTCDRLADEMGFSELINRNRNLLSIGYDVAAQKVNASCYDLLASEARTATFIAVAKEDLVQDGWFRLGRQHTVAEGETTLISWTGTMFEYLMPVLWMRSHPNTLLDRAVRSAVRVHRAYGDKHRVPWGISEAAYRKTDIDGNYQYSAFGVPGLALNVARSGSLVVSAYSSCLALMVDPVNALKNLLRMKRLKWLTEYGFYESADYTESTGRGFLARKGEMIRCWMAHHQGMSLVAICNVLHDWPFQRWFHAERLVQASDLILQERPIRTKPVTDSRPRRILSLLGRGPVSKARASA
ncbi:MAG: glycosyl transferase [Acidobacteriaceae bacterium]|nr:glycosyl transferase [Acidobacteriaceae bacterium]